MLKTYGKWNLMLSEENNALKSLQTLDKYQKNPKNFIIEAYENIEFELKGSKEIF